MAEGKTCDLGEVMQEWATPTLIEPRDEEHPLVGIDPEGCL